jgi:Flp pilus assembly protein TadG
MRIDHIRRWVRRAGRDERGSIAMIFGFSLFALCGCIGLAVDASRAYSIAARMQAVLDAASLAAAKTLNVAGATDQDVINKANAYFSAHLANHKDLGGVFAPPVIELLRGSQTVNVRVDIVVPTIFAGVIGWNEFTFSRQSLVVYHTKGIELAMVLDTTGSMSEKTVSGSVKMNVMKASAKNVVANLLNTAAGTLNTNRIALVPFSASVNVGSYLPQVASGTSVMGDSCVIERAGGASTTDDAMTGLTRSRVMLSSSGGKYSCPVEQIQPLTVDADLLNAQIDAYSPGGWTSGHMGMAWGWNMISPNFGNVFSGGSTPAAYADKTIIKAVVIMTDGLFNTAYLSGNASADATQIAESNSQFASLCTNMRAKGVIVYTIGFGLAALTPAEQAVAKGVLLGCVADPANFFDTESDDQLATAFNAIAEQLQTLRVQG